MYSDISLCWNTNLWERTTRRRSILHYNVNTLLCSGLVKRLIYFVVPLQNSTLYLLPHFQNPDVEGPLRISHLFHIIYQDTIKKHFKSHNVLISNFHLAEAFKLQSKQKSLEITVIDSRPFPILFLILFPKL